MSGTKGATLLVSRHAGGRAWLLKEAARRGWWPLHPLAHLGPEMLSRPGVARVAGVLPIGLAADLAARGIETWHLDLPLDSASRGMELSASQMDERGARLRRFIIRKRED
ncbi:CRISPR-associated protein Csx16 [Thermaurantiacus sp.]